MFDSPCVQALEVQLAPLTSDKTGITWWSDGFESCSIGAESSADFLASFPSKSPLLPFHPLCWDRPSFSAHFLIVFFHKRLSRNTKVTSYEILQMCSEEQMVHSSEGLHSCLSSKSSQTLKGSPQVKSHLSEFPTRTVLHAGSTTSHTSLLNRR